MALEQYLNPGETIIWEQKKHWHERLYLGFFLFFCLLLVPIYGLGIFLAIGVLSHGLRRLTGGYAITNRRVIAVTGLFSRNVEELPLERITAIEVKSPFSARIFGCGDLSFNPAKAGDIEANNLWVLNIKDPLGFRRLVMEQRDRLYGQSVGAVASLVASVVAEVRPPAPVARLAPPPVPGEEAEWYTTRNGQPQGPITAREMRVLAGSGNLGPNDLVWRAGMDNWTPAGKVKGLFEKELPVALPA